MKEATGKLKIIGICGSLREGSYTRMALAIALQGADALGAQTRILDLRDYNLVFSNDQEGQHAAGIAQLREDVQQADGIIIGTPEYHGGMSGVLKHALDLMGFEQFRGKVIGLVGVSGGAMGAVNALNSLRTVGRALHAWVIPQQVTIPQGWQNFTADGALQNEEYRERLLEVGRQVARFAFLHSSKEVQEFLKLWEQAPVNPGG
jgi:NAD(P)H-dependent FMN reductase